MRQPHQTNGTDINAIPPNGGSADGTALGEKIAKIPRLRTNIAPLVRINAAKKADPAQLQIALVDQFHDGLSSAKTQ